MPLQRMKPTDSQEAQGALVRHDKIASELPNTYSGVPHDKLFAVRVADGLDAVEGRDGSIIIGDHRIADYKGVRNTVHFAMNGVVSSHAYGQFDGGFVIVGNLMDMAKANPQSIAGFSAADTWFHRDEKGEVSVPGAVLFAPEGAAIPSSITANGVKVIQYAVVNEDVATARDAAVRDYLENVARAPARTIKMRGWVEADNFGRPEYFPELAGVAAAVGAENTVAVTSREGQAFRLLPDSHDGSFDEKIESAFAAAVVRLDDLESANKSNIYARDADNGDAPLFETVEQRLAALEREIQGPDNPSSPKVAAYYKRKLDALAERAGPHIDHAKAIRQAALDAADAEATAVQISEPPAPPVLEGAPSLAGFVGGPGDLPYLPPEVGELPRGLRGARLSDTAPAGGEDEPPELEESPDVTAGESEEPPPIPVAIVGAMEADLRGFLMALPSSPAEAEAASEEQRRAWPKAWANAKLLVAELDATNGSASAADAAFVSRFGAAADGGKPFTAAAARADARLVDLLAGFNAQPVKSSVEAVRSSEGRHAPSEASRDEREPESTGYRGGATFSLFGGFSELFQALSRRGGGAPVGSPGDSRVLPALAAATTAPAMAVAPPAIPAVPEVAWRDVQNAGDDVSSAIAAYRRTPAGEAWQAIEAREAENGWSRGEYLKRLKAQPEAFADDPLRGQIERADADGMTQTAKVAMAKALEAYQEQLAAAVENAKDGVPDEVVAQIDQIQKDMAGMPVGDGPLSKLKDQLAEIAQRIKELLDMVFGGPKGPR